MWKDKKLNWLTERFKPFAATKGAYVLKDDILFIEKYLSKMPENRHRRVMKAYLQEWLDGMASEPISVHTQNLGRTKANLFLRDLIEG